MNPVVDFYFDKNKKWKEELKQLRKIILKNKLSEELKWGVPCYTFEQRNIVLLHAFKEYCAILFHKGVLLKDPKGILIQQTKNVQVARQIRFTSLQEIVKMESVIKAYIKEAINVEKTGLKVKLKSTQEFDIPIEFQKQLDELPDLKKAFGALTPGRQRGYLLYFSQAKLSKTRISRIEKCMDKIYDGKGLKD